MLPRHHFWFSTKATYFHDWREAELSYGFVKNPHILAVN